MASAPGWLFRPGSKIRYKYSSEADGSRSVLSSFTAASVTTRSFEFRPVVSTSKKITHLGIFATRVRALGSGGDGTGAASCADDPPADIVPGLLWSICGGSTVGPGLT